MTEKKAGQPENKDMMESFEVVTELGALQMIYPKTVAKLM